MVVYATLLCSLQSKMILFVEFEAIEIVLLQKYIYCEFWILTPP